MYSLANPGVPVLDGPKVHYTLGAKHILVSLSKLDHRYRTRQREMERNVIAAYYASSPPPHNPYSPAMPGYRPR
jgi:hypothetical protein